MSANPRTAKPRCLYPRGISGVALLTGALAFHIASVLTPLITVKHDEYKEIPTPLGPSMILGPIRHDWKIGLQKSHIKTVVPPPASNMSVDMTIDTTKLPGSCEKIHQMVKTLRAFFYIPLGLCGLALLMAVLNMFGLVPSIVHSVLSMAAVPCGAIGCLIAFLIWKNVYCKDIIAWADRPGAHIGVAAPLLIVAVVLEKVAWILSCALPKGPHDLHCLDRCCGENAVDTPSTPSSEPYADAEEVEMKVNPVEKAPADENNAKHLYSPSAEF